MILKDCASAPTEVTGTIGAEVTMIVREKISYLGHTALEDRLRCEATRDVQRLELFQLYINLMASGEQPQLLVSP